MCDNSPGTCDTSNANNLYDFQISDWLNAPSKISCCLPIKLIVVRRPVHALLLVLLISNCPSQPSMHLCCHGLLANRWMTLANGWQHNLLVPGNHSMMQQTHYRAICAQSSWHYWVIYPTGRGSVEQQSHTYKLTPPAPPAHQATRNRTQMLILQCPYPCCLDPNSHTTLCCAKAESCFLATR